MRSSLPLMPIYFSITTANTRNINILLSLKNNFLILEELFSKTLKIYMATFLKKCIHILNF